MIVDKSIDQMIEDLNGYVSLKDYLVENIGDWTAERKYSYSNSVQTNIFDYISDRIISGIIKPRETYARFPDCESWVVSVFEEALANSIGHGNNKDHNLITSVKVIECDDGYIVRIRDSGEGFNPTEIARKRENVEHGSFKYLGEGFNFFLSINAQISYENNGTVFNVAVHK